MNKRNLRTALLLGLGLFCFQNMSAKVWRVNNNTGVSADFSQLQTATASPLVNNGDTIYIEGSATIYGSVTLTKRLVFIGTGYFLNENTGLQASVNDSWVTAFTLDSLSSGSQFLGLRINQAFLQSNTDNILFTRCRLSISPNTNFPGSKLSNLVVNKCFISSFNFGSSGYVFEDLQLTNSIVNELFSVANSINSLIRNNIFLNNFSTINSYVTNNIFLNGYTLSFNNSTVKYNISQSNNLPAGNNNIVNISQASLFTLTGSSDGRYQLKIGSPAIGAGEPINGETPDCGAYGTADPYRLSGIPPIPAIYALTVPASVPSSATSMTITVSTRSNN